MTPTGAIADRVRALRTARRWTAQRLADEMTQVGVEWNRGVVTKLENGHRESVTVAELFALADVFDVSPLSLLLPREASIDYQVTPKVSASAAKVGHWLIGLRPLPHRVDPNGFFIPHPGGSLEREQKFWADLPAYLNSVTPDELPPQLRRQVEQQVVQMLEDWQQTFLAAQRDLRESDEQGESS